MVGKAPIAPLLQTVNAAVELEKVNIFFTLSSGKLTKLSKVLLPSATWYKNDPINESPAPVVSWASTLNDGENTFLSFVINSAPSVPSVYIIISTSPWNRKSKASFSSDIPVINSNSSSLILTMFENDKISKIAFLQASGVSHNGNLTLGSKKNLFLHLPLMIQKLRLYLLL